jgi:hypothetical protein
MSALPPDPAARPRPWRRPGLVALYAGYRAVAAFLIAAPAAVLAGTTLGGHPRGDASLFDPGGLLLLETARLGRRALVPLAASGGAVALLFALFGLVPLSALIAGLGREGRLDRRDLAGRTFAPLGTMALLAACALAAEAFVGVLFVLLRSKGASGTWAEGASLAAAGLLVVVIVAVGVLHDLARVAAVHRAARFYGACSLALRAARRSAPRALAAYGAAAILAAAVCAAAFALAPSYATASTPRFLLQVAVDQVAILAVAFLRASWLCAAIGIVDRAAPVSTP